MDDEPCSSSNHGDENGFDVDVIGSQTQWDGSPDFDVDNNEDEDSGDEENGGDTEDEEEEPQIGKGAWVKGQWKDPLDPHPTEPRARRTERDLDPDFDPDSEVMAIVTLLSVTFLWEIR